MSATVHERHLRLYVILLLGKIVKDGHHENIYDHDQTCSSFVVFPGQGTLFILDVVPTGIQVVGR